MTMPNPNKYSQHFQGNAVRQPSEAQVTRYYEACTRKKIQPKDVANMTRKEMSQELERVYALPTPASMAQLDLLRSILQELIDGGIAGVKMPSESFFNKLTMDTAPKWIDDARALRAKNFDKLSATDVQLDEIVAWYNCPEIDWSNISVMRTGQEETFDDEGIKVIHSVSYTENVVINRKIILDIPGAEIEMWRTMTPEEFKEELKQKLTHNSASALISKYRFVYRNWLRTRITDYQKKQIRTWEERLATLYVPKEVTVYDMDTPFEVSDMEMEEDTPFGASTTKKVADWNPTSYVALDEVQINMLSKDEAYAYIQQLQYEYQAKELYNVHGAQELSGDFEEMRTAKNEASARTKEFTELNNVLYALQSAVGDTFELTYTTDDGEVINTVQALRDDAMRVFFGTGASAEQQQEVRDQIIEFMKEAIIRDAVTFKQLINMCDKSDTAQEILNILTDDVEFSRILIKKQLANK